MKNQEMPILKELARPGLEAWAVHYIDKKPSDSDNRQATRQDDVGWRAGSLKKKKRKRKRRRKNKIKKLKKKFIKRKIIN